jgi:hypothetical protein
MMEQCICDRCKVNDLDNKKAMPRRIWTLRHVLINKGIMLYHVDHNQMNDKTNEVNG